MIAQFSMRKSDSTFVRGLADQIRSDQIYSSALHLIQAKLDGDLKKSRLQ